MTEHSEAGTEPPTGRAGVAVSPPRTADRRRGREGAPPPSSDPDRRHPSVFTNSILLDATGGLVAYMGEAIALDRRKARIGKGRRHCDNRNLPRRNAGEHANSGGAVDTIFHFRASPIFTSTSSPALL